MPKRSIKTPYYHDRAEEVRAIALGIFDLKERSRVMQIADDYEELARAAGNLETRPASG